MRCDHPGKTATVTPLEYNSLRVKPPTPQPVTTPGPAVVFYQDDLVVVGGWIMR
jgi:tRNA U34 2-thiouridine synthase MnmA/TrmU